LDKSLIQTPSNKRINRTVEQQWVSNNFYLFPGRFAAGYAIRYA
jgi:hypothetical protein